MTRGTEGRDASVRAWLILLFTERLCLSALLQDKGKSLLIISTIIFYSSLFVQDSTKLIARQRSDVESGVTYTASSSPGRDSKPVMEARVAGVWWAFVAVFCHLLNSSSAAVTFNSQQRSSERNELCTARFERYARKFVWETLDPRAAHGEVLTLGEVHKEVCLLRSKWRICLEHMIWILRVKSRVFWRQMKSTRKFVCCDPSEIRIS